MQTNRSELDVTKDVDFNAIALLETLLETPVARRVRLRSVRWQMAVLPYGRTVRAGLGGGTGMPSRMPSVASLLFLASWGDNAGAPTGTEL